MFQGAPPGRAFEVGKRLCGDQDRNSKVDVWRPLDRQPFTGEGAAFCVIVTRFTRTNCYHGFPGGTRSV